MGKLVNNKKMLQRSEFLNIIYPVADNRTVQKMKLFRQHCNTSCFVHCFEVSFHCYKICKALRLDYVSAARGAMLHDLFLYDWRHNNGRGSLHALHHGQIAYENARELFDLNEIERDVIVNHMWPVSFHFPKTPEGLIITFVDKYCALKEIIGYYVFKLLRVN